MNFIIKQAAHSDYPIFADTIQSVWEHMEHQEWFAADNADYLCRTLLPGHGIGYKAIEETAGTVAGIFLSALPGLDESNMGYDIHLPEEELPFVAHMDSVAILPPYRGYGLQYRMMQRAEEDLTALGMKYLLCTVHPDNHYSRDNIIKQGYRFVLQKTKYNGTVRDIFLKQLI